MSSRPPNVIVNSSIEKLWPAYNPNLAPPQASTEGLFQQTQALALIDPCQPQRRGFDCNRDFSSTFFSCDAFIVQQSFLNAFLLCGKTDYSCVCIPVVGFVAHLPPDLRHILVGLGDRHGAGSTFLLLLSLFWFRNRVLAHSLSLGSVVCIISHCAFRHAT
jgi:hypothetical protein